MAKTAQARMLLATVVLGVALKCNDIVEGTSAQVKELVKDGAADDNKAAVSYAHSEGARVVQLPEPEASAPAESPAGGGESSPAGGSESSPAGGENPPAA